MIMRAIVQELGFALIWIGIGAGFIALCLGWWDILGKIMGWPQ